MANRFSWDKLDKLLSGDMGPSLSFLLGEEHKDMKDGKENMTNVATGRGTDSSFKPTRPVSPKNDHKVASLYSTMTEKLFDRIVATALPTSPDNLVKIDQRISYQKSRPPLSIQLMSKNFRQMTARTGVMFDFYWGIIEIFSWQRPSFTLSILSLYTFLCLNPRLIPVFPVVVVMYRIMTPAFVYRHPPEPSDLPNFPIIAQGPPINDASIPKPVPEMSREFYLNVVDTQNLMPYYFETFDSVNHFLQQFAFFDQDESRSSLVFVTLLSSCIVLYYLVPFLIRVLPFGLICAATGWILLSLNHPLIMDLILSKSETELSRNAASLDVDKDETDHRKENEELDKQSSVTSESVDVTVEINTSTSTPRYRLDLSKSLLLSKLDEYAKREFQICEEFEQRQVEIFEIQSFDEQKGHWQPSLFSSHMYTKLSESRICGWMPTGPSTISGVLAPNEWEFMQDSWKLEMDPEEWVLNQFIIKVDVDLDEKWVYDLNEEGIRSKDWRRRRWTRSCIRKRH